MKKNNPIFDKLRLAIKNTKINKIWFVIFIFFASSNKSLAEIINKYEIEKSLNFINEKLPATYHGEITREKVKFDYISNYFINRYTLLNDRIIQKYSDNKKTINNNVRKLLCEENSDTQKINKMGIGTKYIYYNFNRQELFSFIIKNNECDTK